MTRKSKAIRDVISQFPILSVEDRLLERFLFTRDPWDCLRPGQVGPCVCKHCERNDIIMAGRALFVQQQQTKEALRGRLRSDYREAAVQWRDEAEEKLKEYVTRLYFLEQARG